MLGIRSISTVQTFRKDTHQHRMCLLAGVKSLTSWHALQSEQKLPFASRFEPCTSDAAKLAPHRRTDRDTDTDMDTCTHARTSAC